MVLGQKPPGHKPPDKNPLDKNLPCQKPPGQKPPRQNILFRNFITFVFRMSYGKEISIWFLVVKYVRHGSTNNKKRSHTQLDSRKQVIAFQDRVMTINIKEAQHPLK